MADLHTVNKSPFEKNSLADAIKFSQAGSAILLIEDGVYGAMKGTAAEDMVKGAMGDKKVYALKSDLMARAIKAMGIKMVLSGEGSDEIFGGYLYFHKAPNAEEFHKETVRKLDKLHQYDCLRANKSLAAWGIEGRVPFLDKEFMDVAMRLNPKDKMITLDRMEKWILRKAFEDMLPESVAWRQKEQFSDGVGYSWIDTLKEMVDKEVSDEQLANAHFRFPIQPPKNK